MPLTPGNVEKYEIDLWFTSRVFVPGHRIRVSMSSALFPKYDRNLNTGGNNERDSTFVVAHQRLLHDAAHPSHVTLPVIASPTMMQRRSPSVSYALSADPDIFLTPHDVAPGSLARRPRGSSPPGESLVSTAVKSSIVFLGAIPSMPASHPAATRVRIESIDIVRGVI